VPGRNESSRRCVGAAGGLPDDESFASAPFAIWHLCS
jgi:hypothetical protein